jgi:hypothetical protein
MVDRFLYAFAESVNLFDNRKKSGGRQVVSRRVSVQSADKTGKEKVRGGEVRRAGIACILFPAVSVS